MSSKEAPGESRGLPCEAATDDDVRECLLLVEQLSKSFGGNKAVRNLHFEASAGEVHGLLGENGAGKSTFTNILVGALRPDEGTITIAGTTHRHIGLRLARRLGVVGVFQDLAVIPDLSVAENVWIGREPRGPTSLVRRSSLLARTAALFEDWGIEDLDPRSPAQDLDLARRQQVAIARALSFQPRILVLDEATSALAAKEAGWLVGVARTLANRGSLVLYISHRLAEVREVTDRVSVMRNGSHVLTARTAEIGDDELVEAMLGRSPGRLYPDKGKATRGRRVLAVTALRSSERLKDVSFELYEGEIVGLSGIQGQGQEDLMSALVGLLPAQGEISVLDKRHPVRNPAAALGLSVGMALLPLERKTEGLLLSKTICENVVLPVFSKVTTAGVIRRQRERSLVEGAVRDVRVRCESIEQPVWQLSGGNQQKVVLARLLLTRARILLLADPVRGVDVGAKAEILAIVRRLADSGYAILYYSSDVQELVHVADRVLVMSRGTIVANLDGEGLDESAVLSAAVSGRAWSGVGG